MKALLSQGLKWEKLQWGLLSLYSFKRSIYNFMCKHTHPALTPVKGN